MGLKYRLVTTLDAEVMTINRNRHRECFFHTHEVSLKETETWIEHISSKYNDFTYIIYDALSGTPVAQFGIYDIVKGQDAEIGRLLLYEDCGKFSGEVRSLCREIIIKVSDIFGLVRIKSRVNVENKKSIYFTSSIGFRIINTVDTGILVYHELLFDKEIV